MPQKKPDKPYKDFPLFAHGNGQWAKKIRGRLRYFGPWADWQSALNKYLTHKDLLQAGREPVDEGIKLWELGELFLQTKMALVENGELSRRTWMTYEATVNNAIKHLGSQIPIRSMTPLDFELLRKRLSENRGAVSLGNEIQRVRTLFKYAYEAGHLSAPMRFGPGFKRPQRRVIRKARNAAGKRMFHAAEIRKVIYAARPHLRAMTLLGINCGFGQSDIANLPLSAVADGWVEFPRPKTEIPRRCPLWPETVESLERVLENRPKARSPEYADLVFLTRFGLPWVRISADNKYVDDNLSKAFSKLLKDLGIKRPKIAFYALRHTFETISGEAKDQIATDLIMGHVDPSMAANYRHWISNERLQAVVEVVHRWLFPRPRVG